MTEIQFQRLIYACNKIVDVSDHLNMAGLPALEAKADKLHTLLMKEWSAECKRRKRARN